MSSSCYNYPCGTRACTDEGAGSFKCAELTGDLTCGFEQYETGCDELVDIYASGDDADPAYNTGKLLRN